MGGGAGGRSLCGRGGYDAEGDGYEAEWGVFWAASSLSAVHSAAAAALTAPAALAGLMPGISVDVAGSAGQWPALASWRNRGRRHGRAQGTRRTAVTGTAVTGVGGGTGWSGGAVRCWDRADDGVEHLRVGDGHDGAIGVQAHVGDADVGDDTLDLAAEGAGCSRIASPTRNGRANSRTRPANTLPSDCCAAMPTNTLVRAPPRTSWPIGTPNSSSVMTSVVNAPTISRTYRTIAACEVLALGSSNWRDLPARP